MMLKNLIKQEFSIEELKASMAKKIAEEKDIIAKLEQFEIEAKNMPGEIIQEYEYQSSDKENIKKMIDKQKNELDQFIEKFSDLEKFIKEYKEEEIQIGRLKETILGKKNRLEEIERRIRELEGRLRTFKIDIDNLRNDNSKFLILIDEWTK